MVTILHISDLHFEPETYDQEVVICAYFEDLKTQVTERSVDLVIFSGDLINRGGSHNTFLKAKKYILHPTLEVCGLNESRLFIVPGNHDICREDVVEKNKYAEHGFASSLTSLDLVNEFVDSVLRNDASALAAFTRLEGYRQFERETRSKVALVDTPLFQAYKLELDEATIGVGCFNTAWRCTGAANDVDKGKLLLGERSVDIVRDRLDDTTLNIAVFHHPLEYLIPFEASAVEARLQVGFDLLCFGHVHSMHPHTRQSPRGKAFYSQAGALYKHRDYHNGYQFIDVDLPQRKGTVFGRSYFDHPRQFRSAVNVLDDTGIASFSIQDTGTSYKSIDAVLRIIRPFVRERANRHVTIDIGQDQTLDDIELVFVCPPMKVGRARSEVAAELGVDKNVDLEDIIDADTNYVVYGGRESGKTSLANLIAVRLAAGFGKGRRIPVVVDGRALKKGDYAFERAVGAYFADGPVTKASIVTATRQFPVAILLDNFNPLDENQLEILRELVARPNMRVIAFAREEVGRPAASQLNEGQLASIVVVHLNTLPRNSIRKLSQTRAASTSDDGEVFTSVMASLNSASLPWNGYIVSLLLFAYRNNKAISQINEAVLIGTVVDMLLNKGDPSNAFRSSFDARSKEITLQALAVYFNESNDIISEADLYNFIFRFFKQKGLAFSAPETVQQLTNAGIITLNDGLVSFRFRCFQEYFYALALKEDNELRAHVVDFTRIGRYAREIDLLTSIGRRSYGLISISLQWIERVRPQDAEQNKSLDVADVELRGDGHIGLSNTRKRALRKAPLSTESLDQIMERAEKLASDERARRRKALAHKSNSLEKPSVPLTAEFITAVETLGRVIRNSEFDNSDEKLAALKRFVDYSQDIILRWLGQINDVLEMILKDRNEFEIPLIEKDLDNISNRLARDLPVGMTFFISEQLGSAKLIPTLRIWYVEANLTFGQKFFIASLLFDLRDPGGLDRLVDLAKSTSVSYQRTLIHEKLCTNYLTRRFKELGRIDLENAIAGLDAHVGGTSTRKGAMIRHLRDSSRKQEFGSS